MRSVVLAVSLAALCAQAQAALQSTQANAGDLMTSLDVPFPAAATAGSLIVVSLFYFSGDTVASVTDSNGNVYQRAVTQLGIGSSFLNAPNEIYWARSGAVSSSRLILTITGTGSQYIEVGAAEYSGFPAAVFLDAWSAARVNGPAEVTSGPHRAEPNELLFLFVLCEGFVTGVDGGFVQRELPNGDLIADLFVSAPGNYSATTYGPCVEAVSIIARFGVPTDAGSADAGPADSGMDAGRLDAGDPLDAGRDDAGITDAGLGDGGTEDGAHRTTRTEANRRLCRDGCWRLAVIATQGRTLCSVRCSLPCSAHEERVISESDRRASARTPGG